MVSDKEAFMRWARDLRVSHPAVYRIAKRAQAFVQRFGPPKTEADWIRRTFGKRPITFLQIGAHDGRTDDVLHKFIISNGWRGVLIEPVKDLFDQLIQNYNGVPCLRFENSAICAQDGPLSFWRTADTGQSGPHWVNQLGSLNRDIILKHAEYVPDIEDRIVEVSVEGISFATLLKRHKITKADLILIDTEGHDYAVLRQIDLHYLATEVVIYEQKHLSSDDAVSALRLLEAAGFVVRCMGANNVGIRRTKSSFAAKRNQHKSF